MKCGTSLRFAPMRDRAIVSDLPLRAPPGRDPQRGKGRDVTGPSRMRTPKLLAAALASIAASASAATYSAPSALVLADVPVDWIFVFKLNAAAFPSTEPVTDRSCGFGGSPQPYAKFSQRYATASSADPNLKDGPGLAGTGDGDPLGATFGALYAGMLHHVVWNDQFYRHPAIAGCGDSCGAPWGHSKGAVAWNDLGEGVLIQVTTPSWPASGSAARPRDGDGNTLGCVTDNNVKVSQHFFALRLTAADLEKVLDALANASVVTNVADPTLVANGGPEAIASRVALLGRKSASAQATDVTLSTGVRLISKPSALHVPPWQLVSSILGGVDLRTATWWAKPAIASTSRDTPVGCWSPDLPAPGAVEIATSGSWQGVRIGLKGGLPPDSNHAKIAVSKSGKANYTIFGDMNQQGSLSGRCDSSQNGRGGIFLAIDNAALNTSVGNLINGDTAPLAAPGPPEPDPNP